MLVWYEAHADMIAAISREKQIKKWTRSAKLRTIELLNPDWKDLWLEITASA
jgi:putative endonuclease